jgi:hydroxymethylpyrimidine kinase/phosphomethylpyrimidine kinase/thiamine-phosphate diphosphorylase
MKNKPIVWSISGGDCSGGAGIAADIRTGHVLGVEVCHLLTANTVQNSTKLVAVNAVDVSILAQQAKVLLTDKCPNVIKIGLVVNGEQMAFIVQLIAQLRQTIAELKVVYDPVGSASVGGKLSQMNSKQRIRLLSAVDVITPNFMEAQQLSGLNTEQALPKLASKLSSLGVDTVIVKGGHLGDHHCVDFCLHQLAKKQHISYQLSSVKISTQYSHGGGCSFAMAIASHLAHGYLIRDSFCLTKAFINQGLALNQYKDAYYGAFEQSLLPTKKQYFPQVVDEINTKYNELPAFNGLGIARGSDTPLGLYPVVDSIAWLKRLLPLGLQIIQLRLKHDCQQMLAIEIAEAVCLSQQFATRLFINDHWQLAITYGAYGVHLGQEDLYTADLAAIHAAGTRLGISTHGCYEFLLAQQLAPSYIAIGAIFPTKTKDMTGQVQGLHNLRQTLTLSSNIPVVAIGGINHQRAAQVWQTGVDSIAVVSAVTGAKNPELAIDKFQQVLV